MSASVARAPHGEKYSPADPVQLVANHLRRPRSVSAQVLKPSDPRCPFPLAGEICKALYDGGRGDVAERLRLPLDLARVGCSTLSMEDALILETEVEGAANVAQQAFSLDHSPGARDTMIRRWEKQIEVLQLAVLAAKAGAR